MAALFPPVLASVGSVSLSIVGVGFLIFVHELGHYLACRATRTRVETFSIGFGTRLFGWENLPGQPRRFTVGRRRLDPADHAMDFRVALIPLGGYVKMAGENPGEARSGAPDEFPSKPALARVFIASAGVIMNVITAAVLYFVAFSAHVPQQPAVVGATVKGGPAWQAGIEPGDRVLALGGARLDSFLDLRMETVFLDRDRSAPVEIDRQGVRKTLQVVPRYDEEAGAVQLQVAPAVELHLTSGSKTLEIGGTEAAQVAGIPVHGGREAMSVMIDAWSARPGQPIPIEKSDGSSIEFAFAPADPGPKEDASYKLGIEAYGSPVVEQVRAAAAKAGIEPGDEIRAVVTAAGRHPVDRSGALAELPFGAPIRGVVVARKDPAREIVLPVDLATPAAARAFFEDVAVVPLDGTAVAPVPPGLVTPYVASGSLARYPSSPATEAGIRSGERIVAIAGAPVGSWKDILAKLGTLRSAAPISVEVESVDGVKRTLDVTPVAIEPIAPGTFTSTMLQVPFEAHGAVHAGVLAIGRAGREIASIFRMIGAFFTGNVSFRRNVAGPGTIVNVSAGYAESSLLTWFLFLAYISITLAVLNVLPVPPLDGGLLLFIAIEKIKGSPLKEEVMGRLQFVGLMLLLVLMFFAFKNDFTNLTSH